VKYYFLNPLFWMSFPEIGPCHTQKILGQNSKIDDWMSFPEIGPARDPEICQ